MKKAVAFLVVVGVGFAIWNWDGTPPVVSWDEVGPTVGRETPIRVIASDGEKGLASVTVVLSQGPLRKELLSESFDAPWNPWGARTAESSLAFEPKDHPNLKEGPFKIEVEVKDQPNFGLFARATNDTREFALDRTPPTVRIVSQQHIIRQGGAELVLYRASEDTAASGVVAGERVFVGYPAVGLGEDTFACLFAMGYNDPTNMRFSVWAEDSVGNRRETGLAVEAHSRRYRQRRISISDSFIENVAPEILEKTGVERPDSLRETFLLVNDQLRTQNHDQIDEISSSSSPSLLWSAAFRQLSNSKVEAAFADERTYLYDGEEIDHQTHLGFDLASTAQSAVEASNNGVVLFADYLGIYGNCVILDHGLGLVSLYAHLSSIGVSEGQTVTTGSELGRTGTTGLAAGDHLHFSMLVQGAPVNPLEWWDASWVHNHVLSRLYPPSETENSSN